MFMPTPLHNDHYSAGYRAFGGAAANSPSALSFDEAYAAGARAFASYSAEYPGEPALNKDETRWLGAALIENGAAVAANEVVPAAACHIMIGFVSARRVEIERNHKGVLRYCCSFCHNEAPTPKRCGGCSNRIYCGPACQTCDWTIHREVCKSWARGAVPWAPKAITIFGCDNLKPHAEVPALESMQRVPTPTRHALALWRFPVEAAVGMPANNMSEALRTFFGGGFRDVLHGPAVVTAVPIGSHMDVHDMLWVERTCLRESARLVARPQPEHIAAPATPATPVSATPLFATAASVAPLADAPAADAKDIVVAGAHLADAECEVLRQAKLERAREGAARLALAQRQALSGGATTAGSPVGACADARCHHSQVLDSAPYVRAHCSVCVEERVYHYPSCWRKDQRTAAVYRKMGALAPCPAEGCRGITADARLVDGGTTRLLYQAHPTTAPASLAASLALIGGGEPTEHAAPAVAAAPAFNGADDGGNDDDEADGREGEGKVERAATGSSDDVPTKPSVRTPTFVNWSDKSQPASVTKSKKKKQRKKTAADKARAAAAEADKTTAWQARIHARMEALVLQDVERRKREVAALKNAGAAVVALHPVAVATAVLVAPHWSQAVLVAPHDKKQDAVAKKCGRSTVSLAEFNCGGVRNTAVA